MGTQMNCSNGLPRKAHRPCNRTWCCRSPGTRLASHTDHTQCVCVGGEGGLGWKKHAGLEKIVPGCEKNEPTYPGWIPHVVVTELGKTRFGFEKKRSPKFSHGLSHGRFMAFAAAARVPSQRRNPT